jgi:hypothetical protein
MSAARINTGGMSTAWMNTRKQQDDGLANPGKSLRGVQSDHTACGQLWGKVRGNQRRSVHARGRTTEQSAAGPPDLTARHCRPGYSAHPLWTRDPWPAWANGSCPHRPPCLLRLRSLLISRAKTPTVGAERDGSATPSTPDRRRQGIMEPSALIYPVQPSLHMTCSGQEAARREIPG